MFDSIGKRFAEFFVKVAINILFSPETKQTVIKELNEKVNIPILNEKQEAELFELVYDTVEEAFKTVAKEKLGNVG
jgi:hypothetical protein